MAARLDAQLKEKARHMAAAGGSAPSIAKELGIPTSTVSNWMTKWKSDPQFLKLKEQKSASFAEKAAEIVDLGQILLIRRLKRALENEDEIDEMIDMVKNDPELKGASRIAILGKLGNIKLDDIKAIGVTVGTMFDKQQLATGKPTETVEIKRFEDLINDVLDSRAAD